MSSISLKISEKVRECFPEIVVAALFEEFKICNSVEFRKDVGKLFGRERHESLIFLNVLQ